VDANSPETIEQLAEWADRVIVTETSMVDRLPDVPAVRRKVSVFNVGEDRWLNPLHPELHEICKKLIAEDGGFGQLPPPAPAMTEEQMIALADSSQSRFAAELDESPKEDDLGWKMPNDDLAALSIIVEDYARANPDRALRIVELGTWVGKSALAMVAGIPANREWKVYCDFCESKLTDEQFNQFSKNVGHVGSKGNCFKRVFTVWGLEDIDILFVHRDEYLTYDQLHSWVDKVRDTGIVIQQATDLRTAAVLSNGSMYYSKCGIRWYVKHGYTDDQGKGSGCEINERCVDGN
jgi:predicted O-methyltransferase YrrM